MLTRSFWKALEVLILIFVIILANLRAFSFWTLFPDASSFLGGAWAEIVLWVFTFGLVILILWQDRLLGNYIFFWKRNPWLLAFLMLTLVSTFWSIEPSATVYRSLELIFTSLIGAYIGIRYDIKGLLRILLWTGILFVMISFIIAINLPEMGRMFNPPYGGAWRGIYWNKNHLAGIMSLLNSVFLLLAVTSFTKNIPITIVSAAFYFLSLALVYLSKSAAGYLLVILLHFAVLLPVVWLKFRDQLNRKHYFAFLIVVFVGLAAVLANLKFVFGVFNRDPTLTGRVQLWQYLLENIISQRFWFGYGFGGLWTFESFRRSVQLHIGWGYPVVMADNGYLDMLLHLGIIGAVMFLVTFAIMWQRTYKYALSKRRLIDFFPLILMWFAFFANISFSFFMELESFVWLVMAAVLFQATKSLSATVDHDGKMMTESIP
jgi:exopolysaccharide production protein ExoQ